MTETVHSREYSRRILEAGAGFARLEPLTAPLVNFSPEAKTFMERWLSDNIDLTALDSGASAELRDQAFHIEAVSRRWIDRLSDVIESTPRESPDYQELWDLGDAVIHLGTALEMLVRGTENPDYMRMMATAENGRLLKGVRTRLLKFLGVIANPSTSTRFNSILPNEPEGAVG